MGENPCEILGWIGADHNRSVPPVVLTHTKPQGVLEQPGIREPKLRVTYYIGPNKGGGEGEFHQGIYPKADALCTTHRPAGWGAAKETHFSKSQREGPPANHFRPGVQPICFLFSHIQHNPQESLKPKHMFIKGGLDKRATWECCLCFPFLPHSSGSNREEKGRAGTSPGTA